MTGSSRRTALRLGGVALASACSLSGCLDAPRRIFGGGEGPDLEWVRSFGYSHIDDGVELVRTPDGGFAFLASTSDVGTDETAESDDSRVVRTAADGTERWSRAYGDAGVEFGRALVPATDGQGFVVGGSGGPPGAREVRLLRIDAEGRVAWGRTYDASNIENLHAVSPAADGGYALGGATAGEAALLKVSASGARKGSRTYGPSDLPEYGTTSLTTVVRLDGGGFLLVGHANTGSEGGFSWFRRTDPEGTVEWRARHRRERGIVHTNDAVPTADGGFLAVGSHASMGGWPWESDPDWALKLDGDGRQVWRRDLGSAHPRQVVAEPDGGGVVAVRRGGELRLRRLGVDGETEWRSAYPEANADAPDALVRTDDGYAILGRRRTGSIGDYGLADIVLAKVLR